MANNVKNALGPTAGKMLTLAFTCTTDERKLKFQQDVLQINGAVVQSNNDLKAVAITQHMNITFEHVLNLLDPANPSWGEAVERVVTCANQTGNAQKLDRLTELTLKMMESKPINVVPPKYKPQTHLSLSNFVSSEFQYWLMTQGLDETSGVKYLPLVFEDPIIRDHVHDIIQTNPNNTIQQMLNYLVNNLKLESETTYAKQQSFNSFKFLKSKTMEQNFMFLIQTRKIGWPQESAEDNLKKCKEKFIRSLDLLNDQSHLHVFNISESQKWENFDDKWKVSTYLREVQVRFSKAHKLDQQNNSVAPPPPAASDDMEVDSMKKSKNSKQKSQTKKSKNKTCDICGSVFSPRKPWHSKCKDCVGKRPKKNLNNLEKNDDQTSDNDDQSDDEINEVCMLNSDQNFYQIGTGFQLDHQSIFEPLFAYL